MTSPQPADDQPADDQQGLSTGEQAALAALTAALLGAGLLGTAALPPYIFGKLLKLGLDGRAIRAATRLALADPLGRRRLHTSPGPTRAGTAAAQIAAAEPEWRARYLIAAARRITAALAHGANLFTALRAERRFYDLHRAAGKRRAAAAHAVDKLADEHGTEYFTWQLSPGHKHTAGCIKANGKVFSRTQPLVFTDDALPPRPQFPGTPHMRCKCYALPLFARPGQ